MNETMTIQQISEICNESPSMVRSWIIKSKGMILIKKKLFKSGEVFTIEEAIEIIKSGGDKIFQETIKRILSQS